MLHVCRKELEDTIEYLEASSMELEMKIVTKQEQRKNCWERHY